MITLSERIKLELRHRDPVEITELILDNSKATDIEGITCDYKNLRQLSLVNVGLISLKNFPSLPNLEKLDLSDNRISCGLDYLKLCPNINQLFLTSNKLRCISEVEPLSHLKFLETLDLSNCEISKTENYRKTVFELIPGLKYLDGYQESEEIESDEYYEDDSYTNFYDTDDQEEDENNDVVNANHRNSSGKRGKFRSKVNFINQEDDFDYPLNGGSEFYSDTCTKPLHFDPDLYEGPSVNYVYDDYSENGVTFPQYGDEDDDEDELDDDYEECPDDEPGVDNYSPPKHGSKFAPAKVNDENLRKPGTKRPSCYSDDYQISTKIYCLDEDTYSPVRLD